MNTKVCHQAVIRSRAAETGVSPVIQPLLAGSEVRRISIAEARPVILEYEWLGKMPGWSSDAFGHYFDGHLGGVALLGHTTGSDKAFSKMFPGKRVIVLQRGVHVWWTPKNSASWFISRVCKALSGEYDIITATADTEAGEIGTIYSALNWSYLGCPKHGHPEFLIDGKPVHPKTLYDRHGTSAVAKMREMYGDRLEVRPRVFKHRFAWAIDRKVNIPSLPYPKRGPKF